MANGVEISCMAYGKAELSIDMEFIQCRRSLKQSLVNEKLSSITIAYGNKF